MTEQPPSALLPTTLVAALSALAATPVLLTASAPPVVTALQELWTGAVAGMVMLFWGTRAWSDAPPQVAAFETERERSSPGPLLLILTGVIAGLLSAFISLAQVIAPDSLQGSWGTWIQPSHMDGRAAGHLRQPNHLATVLLWGAAAWAALHAHRRLGALSAWAGMAVLMAAVVASASRTGLLGIGMLCLWGLADRRLPAAVRLALMATPLLAAASWLALDFCLLLDQRELGATARMVNAADSDLSSARFAIWRNTWELIQQQPWFGVGWSGFNTAWTLTPMPDRPGEYFTHPHSLPLQLIVELGVPLGLTACLLLLCTLVVAARRAWAASTEDAFVAGAAGAAGVAGAAGAAYGCDDATLRRGALVMLGIVGLHSLLEYPLWYAYLGMPTALACVVCLGWDRPWRRASRWQAALLLSGGLALLVCTAWAYSHYRLISRIYAPGPQAAPLAQRIEDGQRALWFADQAHYAKATTFRPTPGQAWDAATARAFDRAPRVLLDARLMMAWADALAARNGPGDRDKARHLVQRLREFKAPGAQAWLLACEDEHAPSHRRFVCEPPERNWNWRDFERH